MRLPTAVLFAFGISLKCVVDEDLETFIFHGGFIIENYK